MNNILFLIIGLVIGSAAIYLSRRQSDLGRSTTSNGQDIESAVAGQADILIAPDLESANMLGKQLEYLAGACISGVVLGARIPLALTSRADDANSRIGSALLAKLVAHHYRTHKP